LSVSTCLPSLPNIAATSASYAQMTAVLAGFAFTALVVLLTPTQAEFRAANKRQAGYLFTALSSAFVSLLMTTMIYSVLAGENVAVAQGRTATAELIDALPFALAFIILFHGLTLLLHVGKAHISAVRTVHTITVLILPVLALFYLVSAVPDTEVVRAELTGGCPDARTYVFGLILTAACAVILLSTMIAKRHWGPLRRWAPKRMNSPSIMALVVSLISVAFAGILASRSPDFLMSGTWLEVYLLAAALLLTGIGFLLICTEAGNLAEHVVGVASVRRTPMTEVPHGFWFTPQPRGPGYRLPLPSELQHPCDLHDLSAVANAMQPLADVLTDPHIGFSNDAGRSSTRRHSRSSTRSTRKK
jgi:hypothetical protein